MSETLRRSIMNAPESTETEDFDIYLADSNSLDRFVSVEVPTLAQRMIENSDFKANLPGSYSTNRFASESHFITTEGEFFTAIYNLMMASYGEILHTPEGEAENSNYLYLGIFDIDTSTFEFFYFVMFTEAGNWVDIYENIDDEDPLNVIQEGSATPFECLILSPYGVIPGTENWSGA